MIHRFKWDKFGKDVRQKRAIEAMSIRDVAKRYRIPPATISRADRGLPVSAQTFLILSSYFIDTDPRVYIK